MSDMVEVVIDSVRVSLMSTQRVVVLRQTSVERYLPIWVGPFEAESITVALQEVEVSRPMTHDLLKNVISLLNGKIMRIEIASLKDDIYFGNIVVESAGNLLNIDSRASDAISLAVRAHVPILVNQAVMDEAGIVPEKDLQQNPAPEADQGSADGGESGEDDAQRLDIFEDFLKKLNPGGSDESQSSS